MLHFVDRMKNIVRRSGENISATEVEAVLQEHDQVAQAAVIAVPDEIREEEVLACVVLSPDISGSESLADELVAWCSARLAYFKAPGYVVFRQSLPTTGTHKIQKNEIFGSEEDPRFLADTFDVRHLKRR